jgi:hypothetical protein
LHGGFPLYRKQNLDRRPPDADASPMTLPEDTRVEALLLDSDQYCSAQKADF